MTSAYLISPGAYSTPSSADPLPTKSWSLEETDVLAMLRYLRQMQIAQGFIMVILI